jgi:hypothetical protein
MTSRIRYKEAEMSSTLEQDARIETLTERAYGSPGDALAAATEATAIIPGRVHLADLVSKLME